MLSLIILSKLQSSPTLNCNAVVGPRLDQCAGAQIVTVLRTEHQGGVARGCLLLEVRLRLDQCADALIVPKVAEV